MQWLRPEIVLAALDEAKSARFEFGETPKVVPLRLAQQSSNPATAETPF